MTQLRTQRKSPAARRYALALIFFCAFSVFILRADHVHGSSPARVTYPQELGRVNFAISGDVIPHQAVVESATAAEKNLSQAAPASPAPAAGATAPPETPPAPASPPPAPATDHDGWDALFARRRCLSPGRLRLRESRDARRSQSFARHQTVHVQRTHRVVRIVKRERHQHRFLREQSRIRSGLRRLQRIARSLAGARLALCRFR